MNKHRNMHLAKIWITTEEKKVLELEESLQLKLTVLRLVLKRGDIVL